MANLWLLIICFALGVIARRLRFLPEDSQRVVNAWVMWVSLPALVFRSIHGVAIDGQLLLGSLCLWLVFLIPAVTAWVLVRRGSVAAPLAGAVSLCAGLGNTAFVGLPLLDALGGRAAVGPGAVLDQLGSFTALFLVAMPFATVLGGKTLSMRHLALRLVLAPGVVALVLALLLSNVVMPVAVDSIINRFADMLSPLALASVGWQLDLSALRGNAKPVMIGLGWKLVLAPLLVLGALFALHHGQLTFLDRVIIAQAAMAPMVTAGVVAADHQLAPRLAAALIAVGVPLSILTVPLWWHLLAP